MAESNLTVLNEEGRKTKPGYGKAGWAFSYSKLTFRHPSAQHDRREASVPNRAQEDDDDTWFQVGGPRNSAFAKLLRGNDA